MAADALLVASADFSAFEKAALALSDLETGPRPSRTSPRGDRRKVLDPRSLVAFRMEEVVTFILASLRTLTPEASGAVRLSYNARRSGAGVQSKGSFGFVFEIASDLPDEEQVRVNVLEFGSVPHEIRPVNASFLRFEIDEADFATDVPGRGDGTRTFVKFEGGRAVVFTEKVSHPGTQPHAMFRITAELVLPLANRIAREINDAVGRSFKNVDVKPTGSR